MDEPEIKEVAFHGEGSVGRGLDTVSHFFLSDRDVREILPQYARPVEDPVKESEEKTTPDTHSEVCIVLCPDNSLTQGSVLGCMLALSLAASDISVGLIETTTKLPHPFFLSGGYENLDAVFWESDLDSPDFFNAVSRFRKTCDLVLINTPASILLKTAGFTGLMGRCLIVTTTRSQDLLSVYGTIKSISRRRAMPEIELVVVKQRSADNAAGAVVVLENMARKFLSCSVRFMGVVTLSGDIDVFGALSFEPSPRVLPNAAAAVKEIARQFIISSNLKEKRKQHAEEPFSKRFPVTQQRDNTT